MKFSFEIKATRGLARAGVLRVNGKSVDTPVFMPVGTQASVKSLTPRDLEEIGVGIILANTYHLYLRPGAQLINFFGGLHEFMRWPGLILTDSGGYQVSSLGHFADSDSRHGGSLRKSRIDDKGVTFFSHLDGSEHRLTANKSIKIQHDLGADIIMAFDEATPDKGKGYARVAMERTHRWLKESIKVWKKLEETRNDKSRAQTLFGIIQGGNYKDLRRESAEFVTGQNLEGVAIGGGSIGQDAKQTEKNLAWIRDILPKEKPVYLMGVGVSPKEVVEAVKSGADMFDCVAPTRLARMGQLYSGNLRVGPAKFKGRSMEDWKFESEFRGERMKIANARFRNDKGKLDDKCDCYTCSEGFSRAYLHHLFKSRELAYYRLASLHNVRFIIGLVEKLRGLILGRDVT